MWLLLFFKRLFIRRDTWRDYPLGVFQFQENCRVSLKAYALRYGAPRNFQKGRLRLRLSLGYGYLGFLSVMNWKLYSDGEYGFILEWVPRFGRPISIAIVAFDIRGDDDCPTVIVRQIQGVKGKFEYLTGMRWERMLLHIVTDWASAIGCASVACIQAKDSAWYFGREEQLRMRYDVTAKRSGFRFAPNQRLWIRPLPVPPIS